MDLNCAAYWLSVIELKTNKCYRPLLNEVCCTALLLPIWKKKRILKVLLLEGSQLATAKLSCSLVVWVGVGSRPCKVTGKGL